MSTYYNILLYFNELLISDFLKDFHEVQECLGTADTERQLLICAEQYRGKMGIINDLDKDADFKRCQWVQGRIDLVQADVLLL